jgi:hypothetical protein
MRRLKLDWKESEEELKTLYLKKKGMVQKGDLFTT